MADLPFAVFDADNHYYEAEDAFTRHMDPKLARRAMQWGEVGGRQTLLVAGKINRFIPNPTFDPVAKPGCLDEYFRGRNPDSFVVILFNRRYKPVWQTLVCCVTDEGSWTKPPQSVVGCEPDASFAVYADSPHLPRFESTISIDQFDL